MSAVLEGVKHREEPGCQVKKGVEEGTILASRYKHYLQFLEEVENRKPKYGKKN